MIFPTSALYLKQLKQYRASSHKLENNKIIMETLNFIEQNIYKHLTDEQ